MYLRVYNIDENTLIGTKINFQLKQIILRTTGLGTNVLLFSWYYQIFQSGINFRATRT